MYGTVARLKMKPGQRDEMVARFGQGGMPLDPGEVSGHFFALDNDPDGAFIVAIFTDKEAYIANAQRPETHERYLQLRAFLAEDPVWFDGTVISQSA